MTARTRHQRQGWQQRVAALGGVLALLCVVAPVAWADNEGLSKKELVAKIIKLQQPVIEGVAQNLVEQPAAQLLQQAGLALQARVPADKRDEVGKGIQADVKKYLDEAAPPAKERAMRLAPSTVGVVLEEKFSEEELRQLIAILESPVNRRLQELGGDMQRALSEKLITESRPEVEPKVRVLQQNLAKRLGADAPATSPAAKPVKPGGAVK
ncbi:MAG: hypothetical protein V4739_17785 [Pseudomonadota bacterium]